MFVKAENNYSLSWDHIGKKKTNDAVSRKLVIMIYILLEREQFYDLNHAAKATE